MGLSLLTLATDGHPGQYDDIVRLAIIKATGLDPNLKPESEKPSSPRPEDYCFGVRQLADYLGVSTPTAQKYINEGKLDPAIRKVGRKYSFLKSKVDEIFCGK